MSVTPSRSCRVAPRWRGVRDKNGPFQLSDRDFKIMYAC